MNDIIVAISTALGKGAISIVRLSGKGCIEPIGEVRIRISDNGSVAVVDYAILVEVNVIDGSRSTVCVSVTVWDPGFALLNQSVTEKPIELRHRLPLDKNVQGGFQDISRSDDVTVKIFNIPAVPR